MPIPLLEFLTGPAGSGKTYTLRKRIEDSKLQGNGRYRNYATLTATTGIAAINLSGGTGDSVVTINSELKFFDTQSLQDNFASRKLHAALKEVAKKGRNLCIDEISMQGAIALDLIVDALDEVNELQEVHNRGGLGLIVSGDFCQLPPVKEEFCFTAKNWSRFQITKLDKIWRQSDPSFLEMLNAARQGDGEKASKLIYEMPDIQIRPMVDSNFDGTTIVPVNRLVDSLNKIRLDELLRAGNRQFEFKSFRWGRQLGEWKQIPESRTVCKGAYVMILANDSPKFTYANGSCGYVMDADIDTGAVYIKLKDSKEGAEPVKVRKVTRRRYDTHTPEGYQDIEKWLGKTEWKGLKGNDWSDNSMADLMYKNYLLDLTTQHKLKSGNAKPYFDFMEEKWVVGEITYTPIRLAYASTVHKSQGLSLDRVQIDYSHAFFGEPSMSYVALSRVRTPGGLVVVGNRKLIEGRTNITSDILPWI